MIKAKIENNILVSCLDTDGYVIIPKEVQIIGEGAFEGAQVMAVILHDNVKVIKKNAFKNCKIFNRVYIPKSVKEVGEDAFYDCPNLTIRIEQGTDTTLWHDDWECADEVDWDYEFKNYDNHAIKNIAREMSEAILNLIKLRRYNEESVCPDYYEAQELRQITSTKVDYSLTIFEELYDRASFLKEIKKDKKLFRKIEFLLEFYQYIFKACSASYISESDAKYWRNKCNKYTY